MVENVVDGKSSNAFCVVRPPGHHAGPNGLEGASSCGFCIFNSVAIGALHALARYPNRNTGSVNDVDVLGKQIDYGIVEKLNPSDNVCSGSGINVVSSTNTNLKTSNKTIPTIERVAIFDFDIHHGNGTEAIVKAHADPNQIFFCSVHLHDVGIEPSFTFYPGTGGKDDVERNIVNIALPPLWCRNRDKGSPKVCTPVPLGRLYFRQQIEQRLLPALRAFKPDLIMLSAGFDGGKRDIGNQKLGESEIMQGMDLRAEDYSWLTSQILRIARVTCNGRVVSVLEGGYGSQKRILLNASVPTPAITRRRRRVLSSGSISETSSSVDNSPRHSISSISSPKEKTTNEKQNNRNNAIDGKKLSRRRPREYSCDSTESCGSDSIKKRKCNNGNNVGNASTINNLLTPTSDRSSTFSFGQEYNEAPPLTEKSLESNSSNGSSVTDPELDTSTFAKLVLAHIKALACS